MAIAIQYFHEPLSARSYAHPDKPVHVQSDEGQLLERELRRYCEGVVTGRSFLIAGHRGAGKTTLVANAFLSVWKDSEDEKVLLRPLLVKLHGPSLFPQRDSAPPPRVTVKPAATPSIPPAADAPVPAPKSDAQIALEQITLGLHRAVAGEFTSRFWRRLDTDPWPPNSAEFCAQFEAEVHDIAASGRLREFWKRTGSLRDGVLFRRRISHSRVPLGDPETEQGMRELVALGSVLEAYRRISGEYKRQQSSRSSVEEKLARSAEITAGKQDAVKPVAALATGGVVGLLSATAASTTAASATMLGLLAAFGVLGVFKFSSARTRDRAYTTDDSFVYDLSVSTLDRVLPILIERLRNAGLAPIFVVDELDKVELLSDRILSMVHHLKKLVAEHAFFCFLTDRGYFEQLSMDGSGRAYDISHSYYSHRLLIAFAPERFDDYLQKRLTVEEPAAAAPANGLSPATAQALAAAQAAADSKADLPVVRWILRHRSQLHQLDLDREIAAISDAQGAYVALPPGDVRSIPRHKVHLTMQVAIERLLTEPAVRDWISDRPIMRQLLHDALYYLSRQWLAGEEEIDLSEAGDAAFARYLERRMNREKADASGSDYGSSWRRKPSSVRQEDLAFLLARVRELARFLSDEQDAANPAWRLTQLAQFRKADGTPQVEQVVQPVLLLGPSDSVLMSSGTPGVYEFRYGRTGMKTPKGLARDAMAAAPMGPPAPGTPPPASPSAERWSDDAQYIDAFAQLLVALTPQADRMAREPLSFTTLAEQFRIVDTTPAWSSVKAAIERLRAAPSAPGDSQTGAQPTPDSRQLEDALLVRHFRELLERSRAIIARSLFCGAIVGKPSGNSAMDLQITVGLDALSRGFRFPNLGQKEVEERLERVLAEVGASQLVDIEQPVAAASDDRTPFLDYGKAVEEGLSIIRAPNTMQVTPEIVEKAWANAEVRVLAHLADRRAEVNAAELLTATARVGPARYLALELEKMTIATWSHALIEAWDTFRPDTELRPLWLRHAAFRALGVDQRGALARSGALPREDVERWMSVAGLRAGPAKRRLTFFYAVSEGSPARTWQATPEGVIIAAGETDLRRLFGAWAKLPDQDTWRQGLPRAIVYAADVPPSEVRPLTPTVQDVALLQELFGATPVSLPVYAVVPKEALKEPLKPFIVAPRDAADFIAQAQRGFGVVRGDILPES